MQERTIGMVYFFRPHGRTSGIDYHRGSYDPEEQALKELYDEERVIWLQDWWHKSGASLRTSLDSDVFVGPPQSILINGKGRFGTCVENPELPQCDENGCLVEVMCLQIL